MVLMADQMKQQRASDLLYHKNGEISELTRSNVFMFRGDTLLTPNRNVLNGITRKVVMELAQSHFDVQEQPITYDEFLFAEEAFTTSTTKWVMPIVRVGEHAIGQGTPGKRTLFLQELFEQLVEESVTE
jgi:branched-chain amino acid aminotransferase